MSDSQPFVEVHDCVMRRTQGAFQLTVDHFELGPECRVALTGTNGSGKSTFLEALSGLIVPEQGTIVVGGQPLVGKSEAERCRYRREMLSHMRQSIETIDYLTVVEHLKLQYWTGRSQPFSASQIDQLLSEYGLTALGNRNVCQLSGGQRQRVALMTAIASEAPLLLLDEPTSQMDAENIELVLKQLTRYPGAVLCVTHDPQLVQWANSEWQVVVESKTGSRIERVR